MSNPPEPLTHEEINNLAASFARLQELRNATIQTPTSAAEIKGLVEFLASELLEHASECIGSLIVCRGEYEQLIHAAVPFINRVNSVLQVRLAQQQKVEAETTGVADAQPKGNIITLN